MPGDHEIGERWHGASPREALARALDAAIERDDPASESLRAAVARFVGRAREAGAPPQEVIIALKEALRVRAKARLTEGAYTTLAANVVQWGIDEYYRP